MKTDPIGFYVHIPFCVSKCKYCDFCSIPKKNSSTFDDYIVSLCKEIREYKNRGITLDTVFFGGGTPSLLDQYSFVKIADAIRESFEISDDAEISMEVNPRTLQRENLRVYIDHGVNRFSIGLQSMHKNELKKLGRIHSFSDFEHTINMIRDAGISNINVDVMYGIPDQSIDSFVSTLNSVLQFSPEHLSVYGLILEEGTPLYEMRDSLILPSEDDEVEMYYRASELLRSHGYRHYEISNYAMPDKLCRHNLKYWENKEYIGVGLSAHSYIDKERFSNTYDMNEYILSESNTKRIYDRLDLDSQSYEYVMMHLRKDDGFSLSEYEKLFKISFLKGREAIIEKLQSLGYLKITGDIISLTDSGFYISNWILTELL